MCSERQAPEGLESTIDMINRAYPRGIPSDDYLPLIAILAEEMSEKGIGSAMAFIGYDRFVVCNDVAKVQSFATPKMSDVQRVRNRLEPAGYQDWLSESG